MKKNLFSGFLLVLAVLMLPGCGKKGHAEDILKEAEDTMKNYKSVLVDISGHMENSPASGESAEIVTLDFDCAIRTDIAGSNSWCLSMEGSGKTELDKNTPPFSFRKYMAVEKDVLYTYTYDHEIRSWSYREQAYDGKAVAGIPVPMEKAESGKLRECTDRTSKEECYVLEYDISGSEAESYVSFIQEMIRELAGTKTAEAAGRIWALKDSRLPSIHAAWYINKKNMLPCRYEAKFEGSPDSSLVITFREFSNRPVTVPKEIVLHAEKEYPFTIDPDSPVLDETDPLYEKADGEKPDTAAELPQTSLPDITVEEFERALDELERRGWKLD